MITAIIVIIFLSILILIHELGHFSLAKKFGILVEEFGFGLPPRIWGKKKGETTYSINALPIGGFVKIAGENREDDTYESVPADRIFYNLKIWKRCSILIGGVAMNFLLGWILVSLVFFIGTPKAVIITDVSANTPAAQAGLLPNDSVLGFSNVESLVGFINQNKGKEITLKIERNGREVSANVIPRVNPPKDQGALGIALVDAGQEGLGFFASIWDGFKASINIFIKVFVGIFNLIKLAVIGRGSLSAVTGPIGIVKITAQANSMGFVYLLQLLAMISINLAALNIFPFPALDGGRILFLAIEKLKGSPLPRKFEQYANITGMALLLLLMAVITFKDIVKLF